MKTILIDSPHFYYYQALGVPTLIAYLKSKGHDVAPKMLDREIYNFLFSPKELAKIFIESGYKAIITSVDSNYLEGSYVGRLFDSDFLHSLPPNVDPCGENGEFHSFVFNGPNFSYPIPFQKGDIVFRENRFYYIDLF